MVILNKGIVFHFLSPCPLKKGRRIFRELNNGRLINV